MAQRHDVSEFQHQIVYPGRQRRRRGRVCMDRNYFLIRESSAPAAVNTRSMVSGT
jgi:hypothetical protein